MTIEDMIPYSSEAVKDLIAVEWKHRLFSKNERRECDVCRVNLKGELITEKDIIYGPLPYPCATLLAERYKHVTETRVAVTLILAGDSE